MVLRAGLIGIVLGMIMCNGITIAFTSGETGLALVAPRLEEEFGLAAAFILQTIVSGILGFVMFATTAVYYSERFSILSATLIHGSIAMVSMALVSYFLWWTDRTVKGTLLFLLFILMIYLLIWFSITLSFKIRVDQINRAIEERRSGKR